MNEQFPPAIQAALDLAFGTVAELNYAYRDLLLRCESFLKMYTPSSEAAKRDLAQLLDDIDRNVER